MKDSSIYRKRADPKLALLVQLWPFFSSWRWPKSKKMSGSAEKLHPWNYPNMSKWSLYPSPLSWKNTITFCNIWDIFTRKQGRVTSQKSSTKIWQILFHPHDSWSTFYKKILVQIFSSFETIYRKGHIRKILTQIFKFAWLFWYDSYIF